VVDDGSIDHTAAVAEEYGKRNPEVRLISYSPNRGKGHAVRVGILAARGDLILIDDADGSSPIYEVERLQEAIAGGADLAIGSRAKPDSSRTVRALAYRKFIGNTFNFIVQRLLVPGIYDTQCGFKIFRRSAARDIFSVCRLDGYAFDVEVLYLARLKGYNVEEIAINWVNVEGSKVNVFIDSPRMLIEVLGVALASWLGWYRKPASSGNAVLMNVLPGASEHRGKGGSDAADGARSAGAAGE